MLLTGMGLYPNVILRDLYLHPPSFHQLCDANDHNGNLQFLFVPCRKRKHQRHRIWTKCAKHCNSWRLKSLFLRLRTYAKLSSLITLYQSQKSQVYLAKRSRYAQDSSVCNPISQRIQNENQQWHKSHITKRVIDPDMHAMSIFMWQTLPTECCEYH